MTSFSPFHHFVDLQTFLDSECTIIQHYLDETKDSYSETPELFESISEQILQLFSKWATGITTTIIRQSVLNELRTSRSSQHVKPDENPSKSVLHGMIKSLTFFPGAVTITIQQIGYNRDIRAAVHGSLLPFVKQFLHEGRRIHFANVFFSNQHMIPNQFIVIDLERRKSDINFIIESTSSSSLETLSSDNPPKGLLLRVDGRTVTGITVSDGPQSFSELHLEKEQLGLQMLLRFGDIIVLYKPLIRELTSGVLSLIYGPNTLMFRVPADSKLNDSMSQVSQHRINFRQDGLLFRNSAACRSIRGTVERIHHSIDSTEWTTTEFTLCDSSGHTLQVSVRLTDCPYDIQKTLTGIRKSHFLWIFGLIEQSPNVLYFTNETTLFNPSLMHSIIASDIVTPRDLSFLNRFDTFVARAIIIALKCDVKKTHDICHGTVSRNGICSVCKSRNCTVLKELILFMTIDDSSCDGVEVAAIRSKLPFWGVNIEKWERYNKQEQNGLLQQLIGKEFIFVLSQCDDTEFDEFGYSVIWRVDQCSASVGDVEREVHRILQWHQTMDQN
jgi:hypothetical protein